MIGTAEGFALARLVSVDEGEARDHLAHDGVASVHAADQHLGVVAEELEHGKHGQTAVVELLVGGLELLLGGVVRLEPVGVGERSPAGAGRALGGELVVDIADQEGHLEPAQGGDGLNGGNAVGDGGEGHAGGDVTRELGDLGHDVAQDGQLAHTAVLQLGGSVEGEGLLVDVLGEAQGIEETDGFLVQKRSRKFN